MGEGDPYSSPAVKSLYTVDFWTRPSTACCRSGRKRGTFRHHLEKHKHMDTTSGKQINFTSPRCSVYLQRFVICAHGLRVQVQLCSCRKHGAPKLRNWINSKSKLQEYRKQWVDRLFVQRKRVFLRFTAASKSRCVFSLGRLHASSVSVSVRSCRLKIFFVREASVLRFSLILTRYLAKVVKTEAFSWFSIHCENPCAS